MGTVFSLKFFCFAMYQVTTVNAINEYFVF